MMKSLMLKTLERIINHAVASDADHASLLAPLHNKPISLVLEDWQLTLTLIPETHGFQLSTRKEDQASTYLSGKTTELFPLLFEKSLPAALMSSQIQLSGQMQTLDAYQTFFSQLDIDFEVQLARKVGPTFARAFFLPLKTAKKIGQQHLRATQQDIPEWLQEEANLLPSALRVEDFAKDVQALLARIDRLNARVALLKPR